MRRKGDHADWFENRRMRGRWSLAPTSSARSSRSTSSNRKGARAPDAIALLKQDHRDVEALFKKFEGLGPSAHKSRHATVAKIIEALSMHAGIEEMALYPDARARFGNANDDVLEALEEHHLVKLTLSELEKMRSQDERFTAKVTVLMENVRHHVQEEEGELFPKLRKSFSRAELVELGGRLVDAKRLAPRRPHPQGPDTPPGNVVANAVVAPLDAAAKVAGAAADRVRELIK